MASGEGRGFERSHGAHTKPPLCGVWWLQEEEKAHSQEWLCYRSPLQTRHGGDQNSVRIPSNRRRLFLQPRCPVEDDRDRRVGKLAGEIGFGPRDEESLAVGRDG